jgi:phage recombination protein Bet
MAVNNLTADEQMTALKAYVPKSEQSARVYIELVKSQVLGYKKDKDGKLIERPFEDLLYFMKVAQSAGLDPTLKQIYAVYRWNSQAGKDVMSIQAGIDGLRSIAERTGQYGGSSDPIYEEKDGKPTKATVTVHKVVGGQIMAVTASARWSEYAGSQPMWVKMPFLMLGKCAEALALRKAFPVISGIYTPEEMAQADVIPAPTKVEVKEIEPVVDTSATIAKLKEEVAQ